MGDLGRRRTSGRVGALIACAIGATAAADEVYTDEAELHAAIASFGCPVLIDFDDLPHQTVITDQYAGVTFENTGAWNWVQDSSGGGNFSPPNNAYNIDLGGGGAVRFAFDPPVRGVGLYNTSYPASDAVYLTLFDAADEVVFEGLLPHTSINYLGYVADRPIIARGEAVGVAPTNGFIFIDNLVFSSTPTCCTGDLDGDGTVGPGDLAILLGSWNTPGADLNGDQTTDAADLAILLGAWGSCG